MIIHQSGKFTIQALPDQATEIVILQLSGESIDLEVILDQPNAHVKVRALTIGQSQEQPELSVKLHHLAPNTTADFTGRAWLRQQSQLNFRGLIKIEDTAYETKSYLTHRTLLQDDAAVSPHPALEIDQDQVSASHAATVSQLNEDALFFLTSRGLDQAAARQMLTEAFLSEITDQLTDKWKSTVDRFIR